MIMYFRWFNNSIC